LCEWCGEAKETKAALDEHLRADHGFFMEAVAPALEHEGVAGQNTVKLDKGKGKETERRTAEGIKTSDASGSRPPRPYVRREEPRESAGESSFMGPGQGPEHQDWDDDSDHETDNDSESDEEGDDPGPNATLAPIPTPTGQLSLRNVSGDLLT
jgi:hypothetical protein